MMAKYFRVQFKRQLDETLVVMFKKIISSMSNTTEINNLNKLVKELRNKIKEYELKPKSKIIFSGDKPKNWEKYDSLNIKYNSIIFHWYSFSEYYNGDKNNIGIGGNFTFEKEFNVDQFSFVFIVQYISGEGSCIGSRDGNVILDNRNNQELIFFERKTILPLA